MTTTDRIQNTNGSAETAPKTEDQIRQERITSTRVRIGRLDPDVQVELLKDLCAHFAGDKFSAGAAFFAALECLLPAHEHLQKASSYSADSSESLNNLLRMLGR